MGGKGGRLPRGAIVGSMAHIHVLSSCTTVTQGSGGGRVGALEEVNAQMADPGSPTAR